MPTEPTTTMTTQRRGLATSEFWLSASAMLLSLFLNSGLLPDTHWAVKMASLIAAGLASLGYSYSRAQVKSAAPTVPVSQTPGNEILEPEDEVKSKR